MVEYAGMAVPQLESVITHLSTLVRPVATEEGSSRDPILGGELTPTYAYSFGADASAANARPWYFDTG